MYAVNALEAENRLGNPEFPIAVSFIFGDRDWTDVSAGERVTARNR